MPEGYILYAINTSDHHVMMLAAKWQKGWEILRHSHKVLRGFAILTGIHLGDIPAAARRVIDKHLIAEYGVHASGKPAKEAESPHSRRPAPSPSPVRPKRSASSRAPTPRVVRRGKTKQKKSHFKKAKSIQSETSSEQTPLDVDANSDVPESQDSRKRQRMQPFFIHFLLSSFSHSKEICCLRGWKRGT